MRCLKQTTTSNQTTKLGGADSDLEISFKLYTVQARVRLQGSPCGNL